MNNAKERLITLIATIVIALILLPMLAFGLGSNDSVNTYWQVTPDVRSDTGVKIQESVIIKNTSVLTAKNSSAEGQKKYVTNLYLFIGNVHEAPNGIIEITVDQSGNVDLLKNNSTFKERSYSLEALQGEYLGWVKIPLQSPINQEYIKLSTKQSFEFFEVALLNEDGEALTAEVIGGVTTKNGAHKYYSVKEMANTFSLVADEQEGFSTQKGLDLLTGDEVSLIGAIDNLTNGKSGYVSNKANAMGVVLTSIGVGIFGNSPFGLRIMGFLFFVATVYLIFFFAKKIFASAGYGAAAAGLYIVAGMGASLVTRSSELSIALFFIVASVYFAYDFYVKSHNAKELRSHSNNLILAGFTFAFALSVSLSSIYVLPLLLVLCLIPSVKAIIETRKTFFKESGLEKEYAREKYNKTLSNVIVKTLLGFVIAPIALMIIAYGMGYITYTEYYNAGLISTILKNNAQLFAHRGSSFFFVWALGLGQDVLPSAFGVDSYLFANRALALASCLSLAIIGLLYILLRGNSLTRVNLIVALNESKPIYMLLLTGFLTTWLINGLFLGTASYASFAISLIFAVLSLALLHKIAKVALKKWILRTLTITLCVIFVAFFVLQTPFIFNFNLAEKLQVAYVWLA